MDLAEHLDPTRSLREVIPQGGAELKSIFEI